jgi:orotidine-5'-phosphate decarboxylase
VEVDPKPKERAMEARDRLIFALDVPTRQRALELVDRLAGHVGCFKIGLELFVASGPDLVREVVSRAPVFLDLKLHDIPATVGRAAAVAGKLGVRYLTVHADEGGRAVEAAVQAAPETGILCVTVLTSVSEEELGSTGYTLGVKELARRRAEQARSSGCRGIICSGKEAAELRQLLGPGPLVVTPGIRPADGDAADQRRVVTPAAAIRSGADLIVVGRPIRDAPDPAAAADAIVAEMATVA